MAQFNQQKQQLDNQIEGLHTNLHSIQAEIAQVKQKQETNNRFVEEKRNDLKQVTRKIKQFFTSQQYRNEQSFALFRFDDEIVPLTTLQSIIEEQEL